MGTREGSRTYDTKVKEYMLVNSMVQRVLSKGTVELDRIIKEDLESLFKLDQGGNSAIWRIASKTEDESVMLRIAEVPDLVLYEDPAAKTSIASTIRKRGSRDVVERLRKTLLAAARMDVSLHKAGGSV